MVESVFQPQLPSAVDEEKCAISLDDVPYEVPFSSVFRGPWSSGDAANSTTLMSAILTCESAGRVFTPAHIRKAFMSSWLASQTSFFPKVEQTQLAFSIPGDGIVKPFSIEARERRDGQWSVRGMVPYVEARVHEIEAVVIAVPANKQQALLLVPVRQPGVRLKEQVMLDPSRPGTALTFGTSPPAYASCFGDVEASEERVTSLRSLARALVAAEMLGIATMALALARRYSQQRFQFGKPIFEFQAIAHSCADMLCDIELTRSMLYAVGERPTNVGVPTPADAAKGKFLASELCPKVVDRAVHIFGAEGLTWERGLHLAVRRIQALRSLWGDSLQCEAELALEMGL